MKTSAAGLQFIAREEGEVLHVYKDIVGLRTVGVGHLLTPSEIANNAYSGGITHLQAMELLRVDAGTAESWVNKLVKVPITQNQFDALVSFVFNMGGGGLQKSTLLVLLNKGDYTGAANEFQKWCKAVINGVLTTNAGLLARRKREAAVFLKPDAVDPKPPVVVVPPPPPPVVVIEPVIVTVEPIVLKPEPAIVVPVAPPVSVWKMIIEFILKLFMNRGK